jgi:hypothetical protein
MNAPTLEDLKSKATAGELALIHQIEVALCANVVQQSIERMFGFIKGNSLPYRDEMSRGMDSMGTYVARLRAHMENPTEQKP